MKLVFLFAFILCFSGCFAFSERFLESKLWGLTSVEGSFSQIDLSNPPDGFSEVLDYIIDNYHDACNINGNVFITYIKEAYVQVVAGLKYKVVFNVQNHSSKVLTVKLFEGLPDSNGETAFEINSCE